MDETPIDLTALGADTAGPRFEATVTTIVRDGMAARASRAIVPMDALSAVASMWRPALIAAGIAIAAGIGGLAVRRAPSSAPRIARVDALGIPDELRELIRSDRVPSLGELHEALAAAAPRRTLE